MTTMTKPAPEPVSLCAPERAHTPAIGLFGRKLAQVEKLPRALDPAITDCAA